MKLAIDILEERISAAMVTAAGRKDCSAIVRPSTDPKFGDYQANGVMALAKKIKTNPRKLAEEVVKNLDVSDFCEPPEVAGPGFINLRLKSDFIADSLLEINADSENRLGIYKESQPKTIVVDFSSPNIAKQMFVGHLRSTIIGDCICRLLEFLGHDVIRQNHIGDWGTQFGRVILGLWHLCMADKHGDPHYYLSELEELRTCTEDKKSLEVICRRIHDRHEKDWQEDYVDQLGDGEKYFHPFLDKLIKFPPDNIWQEFLLVYQYVNILEESANSLGLTIPTRNEGEKSYESLSRHVTAMLQRRNKKLDEQELKAWEFIRGLTLKHCNRIYDKLHITFDEETEIRGESFYDPMLGDVVDELKGRNLTLDSDGAVCVFPEGFKNKEGEPLPFIIQKSDGAYLYATTDLAAIRYRINELKADKIVYVTDSRQKLHFEMLLQLRGWRGGWVTVLSFRM